MSAASQQQNKNIFDELDFDSIPELPKLTRQNAIVPEDYDMVSGMSKDDPKSEANMKLESLLDDLPSPPPIKKSKKSHRVSKKADEVKGMFRYRSPREIILRRVHELYPSSYHSDIKTVGKVVYFNLYNPVLIEMPDYVHTFGYRDVNLVAGEQEPANQKVMGFLIGDDRPELAQLKVFYKKMRAEFRSFLNNKADALYKGSKKLLRVPIYEMLRKSTSTEYKNYIMNATVYSKTRMYYEPDEVNQQYTIPSLARVRVLFLFGGFMYHTEKKMIYPCIKVQLVHVYHDDIAESVVKKKETFMQVLTSTSVKSLQQKETKQDTSMDFSTKVLSIFILIYNYIIENFTHILI